MKKGLRSRLAQYGDEEFALFLRRGFLKGAGFTDEALDRPIVGILSTASDFNPCHKTAPQVAEAVSRGVRMAGALPFVFPTISLHEAFSFPTSMLLRNLMAMDVEEMIKALPLDAVVLIGGCDKTIPGRADGRDLAPTCRRSSSRSARCWPASTRARGSAPAPTAAGCGRPTAPARSTGRDLDRAHDQLMPTSGTCMVMGTASTMACMAETLGFMLPGAATAPAVSSDRARFAEATGTRAVEMAKAGGPRPSEILTKAALRNASVVLQAISGSTNAIVHLAAIAGRAGITYDLDELDRVGREVPVLLDLKPAGSNFMEDFHAGGSLPALWRRLKDHLDLSAKPVNGETLGDVVARWPAYVDDKIIRPLDNPVVKGEAIAILNGNLAPQGAAIKLAAATPDAVPARGPGDGVRLAGRPGEARSTIPNLNVTPQTVMVLRNAGPIGAPGMPEAGALPIPKKLGSKGLKDMVRISDARMSGTAFGTVVLHDQPGGRGRRAARAGARRRHDPARRQGPQAGAQGRRRRACQAQGAVEAAGEARARLHAAVRRHGDAGGEGLRFRFPGGD